jgi:hypothetical protein
VAAGAPVTHGLNTSKTFRLYVHRNGENFVGLCTELRQVIEGSSADEILAKARALVDRSSNFAGPKKPRISVRVSPSSEGISRTAR